MIRHLAILGVGLIGGSLARAVRHAGIVERITGCGRSLSNLKQAQALGVIDHYTQQPAEAVREADMVFIAVPLGAIRALLLQIQPALQADAIVTDGGSVKGSVIADVEAVFGSIPPFFVPGHPIAGTERSGVAASMANLFYNRRIILTPVATTSPDAVERVRMMWQATGARVTTMSVRHHDQVLAATSHLPHMLAFGLVDTLVRLPDHHEIFDYAAGGFRDFTRIASSNPVMWRDICVANREALCAILAHFSQEMATLATMINDADGEQLLDIFTRAKTARDQFIDGVYVETTNSQRDIRTTSDE
jgi:prephenate dehydrogenase